jgi:uncharacterized membrane protein YsdA (DUF1294 family)
MDLAPALALDPLPLAAAAGGWLVFASAATWALFRIDRRRAAGGQRLSESVLLWLSALGGWPGAKLALSRGPQPRFSLTFRGWLNAIIVAEFILVGMLALPRSSVYFVAEQALAVVLGETQVVERERKVGRIVLESERDKALTRVMMLSSVP